MNRKILAIVVALFFSAMAFSQSNEQSAKAMVKYFENKAGAISGYDAVAYFNKGKAMKGNAPFVYNWSGSLWYFKDQANLDAFKLSPQKYVPQYGGYCAYGASENHLSPTDPEAFTIVNDKLYLNYNSKVKVMWLKDESLRIEKANSFWPALNTAQK